MKIIKTKYRDGSIICFTDEHPNTGFNIPLDKVENKDDLKVKVQSRLDDFNTKLFTENTNKTKYNILKV